MAPSTPGEKLGIVVSITEKLKTLSRSGVWKPQAEGDLVAGKVVACETVPDLFGDERMRCEIIDETTGENIVVWCNAWLGNELLRRGVKAGDELGIRFDGVRKAQKTGHEYKAFTVLHEPKP